MLMSVDSSDDNVLEQIELQNALTASFCPSYILMFILVYFSNKNKY